MTRVFSRFSLDPPTRPVPVRVVLAGGVVSGACWYLANGFTGEFGYLAWVAPLPVLWLALHAPPKVGAWAAFGAYLLGRLGWFSYLHPVVTLGPALLITLALPYVFARIVARASDLTRRTGAWYAVFAYPVLFTAYEFLLFAFSPDGTATSIAYTQANVVPVLQIASLTGLVGVTFLVSLVPAAGAVCAWGWHRAGFRRGYALGVPALLVGTALGYGFARLQTDSPPTLPVGLVVLDEATADLKEPFSSPKSTRRANAYAAEVRRLGARGAAVVLLPEGALRLNRPGDTVALASLRGAARQYGLTLVVGCSDYRRTPARNAALVMAPTGEVAVEYHKAHLVRGWEDRFAPGDRLGRFAARAVPAGVAICKDLDFPGYLRRYGRTDARALFVPAWDFGKDDWLHSRMAVLRGVENGLPLVRAARQGRLTVSDAYGRILAEASSAQGQSAALLGRVPLKTTPTPYTRLGEWFGWVNLALALAGWGFFRGKQA